MKYLAMLLLVMSTFACSSKKVVLSVEVKEGFNERGSYNYYDYRLMKVRNHVVIHRSGFKTYEVGDTVKQIY